MRADRQNMAHGSAPSSASSRPRGSRFPTPGRRVRHGEDARAPRRQRWRRHRAHRRRRQKHKKSDVDLDGEWPRFSVRFQGDGAAATATYELWCTRVSTLGGTGRILKASLRGSDGTNLQYMDEELQKEYQAMFDALPKEAQDQIDELMQP
jgi:hypothetical protein